MKVFGAGMAIPRIETHPLGASFRAALVACLAGFGAFAVVLELLAPDGGNEAVPRDLFLVGANLIPLAAVAFVASSAGLFFGLRILHWAMGGLTACFVAGVAVLWFWLADQQSYVDQAFLMALLVPGLALLAGHWSYFLLRSRLSMGECS
ncbi:hypothetical protein [Ciceribacter ferrooxidans]|uniref:Transmembrane protein n=1 Tax=Ciceribacter ferrooxidans TaxID=2509717 RepID=A0A4Q2TIY7_9HYPH|nr:hypothetical protein [Ciceribacter ferrooxidans]RYC17326.1 hypothetical protein EUU22_04855 [Ciceribacter ferrooxidans]